MSAAGIDKGLQVNFSCSDTVRIKEVDPVFDRRDSVWNFCEITLAHRFFLVNKIKRSMVGSNGADETVANRVPQDRLIPYVADWRRHHVLGTFKVRFLSVSFVENQIRNHSFNPSVNASVTSGLGGLDGSIARRVNDINMGPGQFGECHQVLNTRGLDRLGARWLMILGAGFTSGNQFVLKLRHGDRVFTMGGHDHAKLFGKFECFEKLFIVDSEGTLIGEKNLER